MDLPFHIVYDGDYVPFHLGMSQFLGRRPYSRLTHLVLIGKAGSMSTVVSAPLEWVETVSDFRLPVKADTRLQRLMDENNEGLLTDAERAELEAWVEVSETLSLLRAEAIRLLGRTPR